MFMKENLNTVMLFLYTKCEHVNHFCNLGLTLFFWQLNNVTNS